MSNKQVAPETKGVTSKLLTAVDLGPEIEGMAGRQLRMRMVTIEPGGVFGPIHDHKDRPGIVYILQGTITVQFFFSETESENQVSRFRLWDPRFENPMVAVEKGLPYLPQYQRSRPDSYLGYPPQ